VSVAGVVPLSWIFIHGTDIMRYSRGLFSDFFAIFWSFFPLPLLPRKRHNSAIFGLFFVVPPFRKFFCRRRYTSRYVPHLSLFGAPSLTLLLPILTSGPDLGVWPGCWDFMEFLHARIPKKGSDSTTTITKYGISEKTTNQLHTKWFITLTLGGTVAFRSEVSAAIT